MTKRNEEKMVKELIEDVNKNTREQWEGSISDAKKETDEFIQQWFYVNHEMNRRRDCVMEIQKALRSGGYDVKMDMQNYELSYYGRISE